MKWSLIVCVCMNIWLIKMGNAQSQSEPINVGEPFPELHLKNLINYNKKELSINELKGQWVMLDFWSHTCRTCIGSLPKLDSVQQYFKDKLTLILLGWKNGDASLRSFDRFSKKYKVSLPITFSNEPFERFDQWTVPYFVLIDPKGITRAIITYPDFNIQNITSIMEGRTWDQSKPPTQEEFDPFQPLLVKGNGGEANDFLFRSLLMNWNKKIPSAGATHVSAVYGNMIQIIGSPLERLYFLAYQDTLYPYPVDSYSKMKSSYGKYWLHPLLEISDSSDFIWDANKELNLFCYSLIVPPKEGSAIRMQEIMQRDLENYFGYKVKIEKRMMPCWKLVANNKARRNLPTKQDSITYNDYNFIGFEFRNVPVSDLITKLWWNFQKEPQFVDATGITQNIDITIDTDLTDFEAFRKALNKFGLNLVKGKTEFMVIVIRDKDCT